MMEAGGMTMLQEIQFTEARNQLSTIYDTVFNAFNPAIIKRKQSEEIALIRVDLLKTLLAKFTFQPEVIPEEDGSVTLALDQLELYANNATLETAVQDLIQDLKIYAEDYIERPQLFLQAPNRKGHFPYILRILLCENDEDLCSLLELVHAS
jgi:antitoxin YefM